jgi:hypothetical protein
MNGSSDNWILAINRTNSVAHLYESAVQAANSRMVNHGNDIEVEFFDNDGFRMIVTADEETGLKTLKRGTGTPAPQQVIARLDDAMQAMVLAASQTSAGHTQRATHDAGNGGGPIRKGPLLEQAPIRIPDLTGLTLQEAFEACADLLGHDNSTVSNPLHNLFVHGIFG